MMAGDLQSVGSIGTASDGAGDNIAKRTPASKARKQFGHGQGTFGAHVANKMQSSQLIARSQLGIGK